MNVRLIRLVGFQSPFHRGNGCNAANDGAEPDAPVDRGSFQSPFHRGNGCNSQASSAVLASFLRDPFSPLFIGVTVVTPSGTRSGTPYPSSSSFQSPFHRGNGCNAVSRAASSWHRMNVVIFQSPFHRGNGCNAPVVTRRPEYRQCTAFSPLFIGVTVVTLPILVNLILH